MSSSGPSPASPWEPPLPEELQAMLPQYEILGILGRGGMGAVYKAKQAKLDRIVAIKVLPETFTRGEDKLNFAKRFEQEARAMAKLDHPAILSVYDYGETAGGQLYFVMEFIDGMDIHQYLKSHGGKLPAEHALAICAHVLDALEYAHKHGIVHRDIKPANILLNREGRVKIADFGLAKKFGDHADVDAPALTMSNVAVGTPDFVAPEALDSDQVPDHRADLYAVGVMLYQMLTGKLPRGNYQMPSELNPGLDPRFDEIVSKAMAANPDCRYPTAASVREDLDLVLSGPITRIEAGEPSAEVRAVVPATTSLRGKKPVKKPASKTPLFLGLGAAAAVIAGLVILLAGKRGEPETLPAPPPEVTVNKTPEVPVQASTPAVPVPVTAPVKTPEPVAKTEPPKAEAKPAETPAPPVVVEEKKVEPAVPMAPQPEAKPESKPAPAPESAPHPLASVPGLKTRLEAYLTARRTQLTDLATKYGRGLDTRLNQAADAGDLNLTAAYEEEKKQVEILLKELTAPVIDPAVAAALVPALPFLKPTSPEPLLTLRQTWTTESGKILTTLDAALQQSLKVLESERTKARDLETAKLVLAYRETLASPNPGKWKSLGLTGAIPRSDLSLVTRDKPFENTLGMKFVPVPGTSILLCIHETRRRDYAAYAEAVPGVDETWKAPLVEGASLAQNDDHPVVQVSWDDATAFCEWLGKEEGRTYRLPNDFEWNLAAALDLEDPTTINAADLAMKLENQTPWGAGKIEENANFKGTNDGFEGTSPVMSLKANSLGIFDLAGNAWEWSADWVEQGRNLRSLRGGCYRNDGGWFRSGVRIGSESNLRVAPLRDGMRRVPGFRCAIETGELLGPAAGAVPSLTTGTPAKAPQSATVRPSEGSLEKATKDQPFTNSLGMKFVPVTGTNVLFCIHETRRRDYAVYAGEAENINKQWQDTNFDSFQITDRLDDHPVANVDWDDAKAFCAWLSKREGFEIRLPTDEEWSFAVGIGRDENRKTGTPLSDLNMALKDQYPWGNNWPPRAGAGNFGDKSRKEKTIREGIDWIEEYDDGFPATAPVMSFKPNRNGLYDLGGNILEWCEDWYDEDLKTERVLRGGSWFHGDKGWCLSSIRYKLGPNLGGTYTGFRCVIEVP